MPLPEKRYFTLDDLIKRWGTDLGNLRYYAEHKLLEIQVWLERRAVRVFEPKETKDGKAIWVGAGLTEYKGYVVLDADEIRKVFRLGECVTSKFTSIDKSRSYRILKGKASYRIAIADMMVTKAECERFEVAYDLSLATPQIIIGANIVPVVMRSFSGRPSVMFKIEQQMRHRAAVGTLELSLKRESEHLHLWAGENIKDHQLPRPRTIANALRYAYGQLKAHKTA